MAKKKNIKVSLYNKVQKEFSKINAKLPEYQQLSAQQRRQIISKSIYPFIKDKKVLVRDIRSRINSIVEVVKETTSTDDCNPLLIDPSTFVDVAWYDVSDFIANVLPNCIYVQVDANGFGQTKIFNTRNYNYYQSGVKQIIENIRKYVDSKPKNEDYPFFSGFVQVRPNRKDDKKFDSYFVQLVLNFNGEYIEEVEIREFEIPQGKRRKVNTITNEINKRKKELVNTRRKKRKALETTNKNIKNVDATNKKLKRTKSNSDKLKLSNQLLKEFNKAMKSLEQGYAKGYFTKTLYNQRKKELIKAFRLAKGGEI
jgi:vacuolar-type H+-ATPase subunit I/STV1